jgi:Tfp pilus assembly protein PilO
VALSRRTLRFEQLARLLGLGSIVLLVLSVGSLYLPFSMVQQVQQQVAERGRQLEQARQAPQQLRTLQQQLESVQAELRFLERGVSQATYIPTMLKQIEQTAKRLQLEIVAVRPQQNNQPTTPSNQNASNQQNSGQSTPKKAYEEQLIEVSLRGKFWSLMSFLKQLDEFPKILAVQTLNAQAKLKPEPEATNPDIEIRLTVKAFIFSQETNDTLTALTPQPQGDYRRNGNGEAQAPHL